MSLTRVPAFVKNFQRVMPPTIPRKICKKSLSATSIRPPTSRKITDREDQGIPLDIGPDPEQLAAAIVAWLTQTERSR